MLRPSEVTCMAAIIMLWGNCYWSFLHALVNTPCWNLRYLAGESSRVQKLGSSTNTHVMWNLMSFQIVEAWLNRCGNSLQVNSTFLDIQMVALKTLESKSLVLLSSSQSFGEILWCPATVAGNVRWPAAAPPCSFNQLHSGFEHLRLLGSLRF